MTMLPTQTDFPAEVVATPVIWDGATAFILSILSAVAAAVIANWLGVNGERRRQEVVLVTIIKRKYEIILQASERAIRAVGDGEPAARELVATVRRELGFVLTICSGLPLKKLDDALDGKAADKPKPKPPEPSPPPVRPIPISYKLEEAKVLTSGLCGTGVEDGYVVTEAAPPPPPAPPRSLWRPIASRSDKRSRRSTSTGAIAPAGFQNSRPSSAPSRRPCRPRWKRTTPRPSPVTDRPSVPPGAKSV